MPPRKDYKPGDSINGLTFLKEVEPHIQPSGKPLRKAEMLCTCGDTFITSLQSVRSGTSTKCKVCRYASVKEKNTKHGESRTKLYDLWKDMNHRVNSKSKATSYLDKGIYVCQEWVNSFTEFRDWALINGYKKGLTIDRRDNNLHYSPDNCRWVTQTVQTRNTRVLYNHNTSGYRGVSWAKDYKKWEAYVSLNHKKISLGYYDNLIDAAKVYDQYILDNNLEHTPNGVL